MRKKILIFILLVFLFFIIPTVSADGINESDVSSYEIKEIHVDVNGDDANMGSKESPYSSLSKAIEDVSAYSDNIIYLSEGTFNKSGDVNLQYTSGNSNMVGSNITVVGAGVNKTFIDGQNTYRFVYTSGINTTLTFKNLTFTNLKATGSFGAVITSYSGSINIDNCVFKDYQSNNYGAIYMYGSSALTIVNSQFVGVGGAVHTSSISKLYLENNTFLNITKTARNGLAVYTLSNNVVIKNNKFINLKAPNTNFCDASIYLSGNSTVINNQFINCSSPSSTYALVYMANGLWLNNTFINSSNADGKKIYFRYLINNLTASIDDSELNIGIDKINNQFKIHIVAFDDLNNEALLYGSVSVNLIGNNNYTLSSTMLNAGNSTIGFTTVPQDGEYITNITLASYKLSILTPTIIKINKDPVDIWVSSEGSDDNDGTLEKPFKTINHGVDVGIANSLNVNIHLLEGNYSNSAFTISSNGVVNIIGEHTNVNIDGQLKYNFITLSNNNAFLTLKNITFNNFYGKNGAVVEITAGKLNVTDCIFKNYTSTNNQGAIYISGVNSTLSVINCEFSGLGGGISTKNITGVYLENNTFLNIKKTSGNGVAIVTTTPNTIIKFNRFINLTANTYDAAIYINSAKVTVSDNIFINCSSSSENYAVVYLGSCVWKNNTFINSSNAIGENIYFTSSVKTLSSYINTTELLVENDDVKNGLIVPIRIYDDMNNSVCMSGTYGNVYINLDSESFKLQKSNNVFVFTFPEVPKDGDYIANVTVYNIEKDVSIPIKVTLNNDLIDLWVSPDGDDENDGTFEQPFKTIKKAIDIGFNNTFSVNVHLLNGTYLGEGNVNLTIANKGNLNIIGVCNKTFIDGENSNWFSHVDVATATNLINLTFINGNSTSNLISGPKLNIKNSTVANCSGKIIIDSILSMDTLIYKNNTGYINAQSNTKTINNSYFADNKVNISAVNGLIICRYLPINIENSVFVNNTNIVNDAAIIMSYNAFHIKNNYFSNNYASKGIFYGSVSGGIVSNHYFINNTFINNKGINSSCLVISGSITAGMPNFIDCKFINNSAPNGSAIDSMTIGNFTNCLFKDNNDSRYGVFRIGLVIYDDQTMTFTNSTFINNGCDIYLNPNPDSFSSSQRSTLHYPISINLVFNNKNITKLSDNITANVYGPCGAIIGGGIVNFTLDNNEIGYANLVNGVSSFLYTGFNEGNYNVSGSIPYTNNLRVFDAEIKADESGILKFIEYWVSTGGSDDNDGSKESPFKSIQYAITQASLNCRNITVHLCDGVYSGNLYSNIQLSCSINITILGESVGKTIFKSNSKNYFANVTGGVGNILISNLTLMNMDNSIIINPNATLYLTNVNFTKNSNIINNGNLFIINSNFTYNTGAVVGGNVIVNNSLFEYSLDLINLANVSINNSIIKDIITNKDFTLISGEKAIIQNTLIYNECNSTSIKQWGISDETNNNPAIGIASVNVYLDNVTITNNFKGNNPAHIFSNLNKQILAKNSKFNNLAYLWDLNTDIMNVSIDASIFENISMIAQVKKIGSHSLLNISNSLFINTNPVINWIGEDDINNSVFIFNDNYWGNNSKAVITSNAGLIEPTTWIIISDDKGNVKLQLTDGENTKDYNGSLPAKISYIDYDDLMIYVLSIGDNVYKLNTTGGNIIMETEYVKTNYTQKDATDETIKSNNLTILYNGGNNKFIVNYTYWWSDALANTNVSIDIDGKVYNSATNENGTAIFIFNLNPGSHTVTIVNPKTNQEVKNVITINKLSTKFYVSSISTVYNVAKNLIITLRDEYNKILAGLDVIVKLNGKIHNLKTDKYGQVKISSLSLPAKQHAVSISFNGNQFYKNSAIVSKISIVKASAKVIANKVTFKLKTKTKTYTSILKDNKGKALSKSKLTLTVNGKTYKATTNSKGKATFKITKLNKKGKYNAVVKFAGNKNFKATSKKVKITVKK